MEVARARPDLQIEAGNGFEVVIEDVGRGGDHDFEGAVLAQEIGREDFDRGLRGAAPDRVDDIGEVLRAAIGEVVAVDRRDDDMLEAEGGDRFGDAVGFAVRPAAAGRPVRTLQKAQARVQVSPMIIMVAWRFSQHSPMLGQPASSQTVCRPFSRTISRVRAYSGEPAARTRIQAGLGRTAVSGR